MSALATGVTAANWKASRRRSSVFLIMRVSPLFLSCWCVPIPPDGFDSASLPPVGSVLLTPGDVFRIQNMRRFQHYYPGRL